jgi:hypothetical protein
VFPDDPSAIDRREFLKAAAGAAVVLTQSPPTFPAIGITRPKRRSGSPAHVIVIGAGAWGGWTAGTCARAA